MENSMKTAVEKIVKEIKDLKMENNKTAKEIKSMKEKLSKQNKQALVDGLQPSTGIC